MAEADRVLGRFRLLAEVAHTDELTLHEARDEMSGEPAGVLVFGKDAIKTLGDVRAFLKRADVLRKMDSPHVPRLLVAGMQDGTWFAASAGAPGTPLEQLSTHTGPLESREAFLLGAQLFRALSHLHPRGVVLQQVLPNTVLLGEDGALRIWNVFAARQAAGAGKTVALTRTDFQRMTYSPPGAAGASRPGNVYSAGMLVAHLLAGGPPVLPKSLQELLGFVQKPSFSFAQPLDAELEKILLSTVAPNTNRRPAARLAYGQILAAADLKARQLEKQTRQLVVPRAS